MSVRLSLFPKLFCYVCGKAMKEEDRMYISGDLWRHRRCKPGGQQKKTKGPDDDAPSGCEGHRA